MVRCSQKKIREFYFNISHFNCKLMICNEKCKNRIARCCQMATRGLKIRSQKLEISVVGLYGYFDG